MINEEREKSIGPRTDPCGTPGQTGKKRPRRTRKIVFSLATIAQSRIQSETKEFCERILKTYSRNALAKYTNAFIVNQP